MRNRVRVALAIGCVLAMASVLLAPAALATDVTNRRTLELPEHLGLVDPATGLWHLEGLPAMFYGNPADVPFMGDWDGDGVDTPGLYRQSDGFVYLRNSNSQGIADVRFFFGNPGDLPLAGDFDGDGLDTVSLYRPAESRVYVINRLGSASQGLGVAESAFTFGNPGDVPFAGDFDGDGIDGVGVHRAATGLVYLKNGLAPGQADLAFVAAQAGDRVVAGDWTGPWDCMDEFGCEETGLVDTLAAYRPAEGRFYVHDVNATGPGFETPVWGEADWMPVSGRFIRHPVDEVATAMVGAWTGTVELQFEMPPGVDRIWPMAIEFLADGTYTATGTDMPWAKFLGADPNVGSRTWTVHGVGGDGAFGELFIEGTAINPPDHAWLESIVVDGDRLTMEYSRAGAVLIQLERVS